MHNDFLLIVHYTLGSVKHYLLYLARMH